MESQCVNAHDVQLLNKNQGEEEEINYATQERRIKAKKKKNIHLFTVTMNHELFIQPKYFGATKRKMKNFVYAIICTFQAH